MNNVFKISQMINNKKVILYDSLTTGQATETLSYLNHNFPTVQYIVEVDDVKVGKVTKENSL